MATDLDPKTDQVESTLPRPSLKIVGLHIRGLKSIGSLDLPQDGLGWDGPIPDFVMFGGINGSGKTTLLEFIVTAFEELRHFLLDHKDTHGIREIPMAIQAKEARIDFRYSLTDGFDEQCRFLIGDNDFIEENRTKYSFGYSYRITNHQFCLPVTTKNDSQYSDFPQLFMFTKLGAVYNSPAVVYFASEQRTLTSPETQHKIAGKLLDRFKLIDRWMPPKKWNASLESRLYATRWEDLNAKEEGRINEANGFDAYSKAFNRFFEGRKQLKWHRGELVVETKSGEIHDLSELSSGEKQVILFMGELLHRWRPGSIILIDEPELHLHESYQTKLWESLVAWQKERGGQVIVATQSDHLFGLSGPGTRVILGGRLQ